MTTQTTPPRLPREVDGEPNIDSDLVAIGCLICLASVALVAWAGYEVVRFVAWRLVG